MEPRRTPATLEFNLRLKTGACRQQTPSRKFQLERLSEHQASFRLESFHTETALRGRSL